VNIDYRYMELGGGLGGTRIHAVVPVGELSRIGRHGGRLTPMAFTGQARDLDVSCGTLAIAIIAHLLSRVMPMSRTVTRP
jgi:hypothetical protein